MSSTNAAPHASDARIVAEGLSYAPADGRALFHDLTLSFGRERTGLVGPNGSGKTTLVRLLSGELPPSSGTVHRKGVVAVLPQELRADADAPLADVLGIEGRLKALRRMDTGRATPADFEIIGDAWDLRERAESVLARYGLEHLSLDHPVGAMSGGEVTLAAVAGLALRRPDFLLLDEPTNHLDADRREALYTFVEEWTEGLLCVSHDRALLRRMDRILELTPGDVRVYGGDYDAYRARRDEDAAAARRELDSARAALRRTEEKAREVRERQLRRDARGRRSRASANVPKILLNDRKARAEATGARVRDVTEREVEERRARLEVARRRVEEREKPRFQLPSTGLHASRTVLEMLDVTVRFPGAHRPVLEDVRLSIVGPERVSVVGPNGSGKSTLLRVVTGRLAPETGTIRRLPEERRSFLDQDGAALDPQRSVLENFRAFHPEMEESRARYTLARFLFADEAALQAVGTLSCGQRLRASLACVLGGEHPPELLVLDEPTNHLDLDALEALEGALDAFDGALLVASHDATFLEAIAVERAVELEGRA